MESKHNGSYNYQVIFAFGGCALFATSYYVVQRTSQVRIFSDGLAAFTFWGWQAVIVRAAVTLPLGRVGAYTIGFLFFWAVGSASSALTCLLQRGSEGA